MAENNENLVRNLIKAMSVKPDTKPESLDELKDRKSKKDSSTLLGQMINYGLQKDALDKQNAVEDTIEAIGAGAAAAKGVKQVADRNSNAKTSAKPVAKAQHETKQVKQAAGAEGLYIPGVTESLDTDNMDAHEFEVMKNNLARISNEMINNGNFDPDADLSEFYNQEAERVAANDALKLRSKGSKNLLAKRGEHEENAKKAGFETTTEHRQASRKNRRMQREIGYYEVPDNKEVDVHEENRGKTFEMPEMVRKDTPAVSDSALATKEYGNVSKVISFMEYLGNTNPKMRDEIANRMWNDLNISGKGTRKGGVSNDTRVVAQEDFRTPQMNEAADKLGKSDKRYTFIQNRANKLSNTLEVLPYDELSNLATRAFGKDFVESWGNDKGLIAMALAQATAQLLYSEEADKSSNKDVDKVVKANKDLLSGKEAPNHAKNATQMWDGWFNTFDPDKMDNEADYNSYLEAFQLLDDYKHGRNILTDSGNTHGIQELMTNPKFIDLILRYNPNDASKVFKLK